MKKYDITYLYVKLESAIKYHDWACEHGYDNIVISAIHEMNYVRGLIDEIIGDIPFEQAKYCDHNIKPLFRRLEKLCFDYRILKLAEDYEWLEVWSEKITYLLTILEEITEERWCFDEGGGTFYKLEGSCND